MNNDDDNKPEDDERTQFMPLPGKAAPTTTPAPSDDDDRTQFVSPSTQNPAVDPPPEHDSDDDRTRITSAPRSLPPGAGTQSGHDESTQFAAPDPALVAGASPPASTGAEALTPVPQPRSGSMLTGRPGGETTAIGVGTLINNNYEITMVLKSGGMGEVYRGVNIHTTAPVAIKAILPELAGDEKAGLLFKREAQTLSELADEAIVRYHNFLQDMDLNRYFLVMEFIEGVPLSDHIDTHGPIPAPAIMTLLKRLAKGLSKAHAQDVIHRDLSPDNVMLPEGDVSEARLIDFGIAKSNVVKEATMHGQFAGKFKYVAPEQLGHYDGIIGPATDIYGLALLVCAAALGRPLDMGSSIVEAVQSRQAIPDLSAVDDMLRPILSHMLEPDPMRRPASMEEVRRMLENPGMIPPEYRQGLPLPPAVELTGRKTLTTSPPGLQVPLGTTTGRPLTMPPLSNPPSPLPEVAPDTSGGGRLVAIMVVVFLAVLGGAGWFAWDSGLIGARDTETAASDTGVAGVEGIPDPQTSTRSGFLAAFDTGACTFVNRIEAGADAGLVEGYSQSGSSFGGLPAAYEEKFGARPEILPRQVTFEQCAALEFARGLQGRGRAPLIMQMSSNEITGGDVISAQVRATDDDAIWAVLIDPSGSVFSLMSLMSESVGGLRSLQFGLAPNTGSQAQPYLLLMVSADRPLTRTAAAQDGAAASELLPLVLDEIAGRGGAASANLGYVLLAPSQ